jgi:hypothetical protein
LPALRLSGAGALTGFFGLRKTKAGEGTGTTLLLKKFPALLKKSARVLAKIPALLANIPAPLAETARALGKTPSLLTMTARTLAKIARSVANIPTPLAMFPRRLGTFARRLGRNLRSRDQKAAGCASRDTTPACDWIWNGRAAACDLFFCSLEKSCERHLQKLLKIAAWNQKVEGMKQLLLTPIDKCNAYEGKYGTHSFSL